MRQGAPVVVKKTSKLLIWGADENDSRDRGAGQRHSSPKLAYCSRMSTSYRWDLESPGVVLIAEQHSTELLFYVLAPLELVIFYK